MHKYINRPVFVPQNSVLSGNSILLPVGTEFSLIKVSKNGLRNKIKLIDGAENNVFFGLFDEKDVDFEIIIDNRFSTKDIGFSLSIDDNKYLNVIRSGNIINLQTVESIGRKFHFKSQNTTVGNRWLTMNAIKYGISYEQSSIHWSKITFTIDVGKEQLDQNLIELPVLPIVINGNEIQLFVKTLKGSTKSFSIGVNNTIRELKSIIGSKEGIPADEQRLVFDGNHLNESEKTIADYKISNASTIHLNLRLRGGYSQEMSSSETDSENDTLSESDSSEEVEDENNNQSKRVKWDEKVLSLERGVICFGDYCNQTFISTHLNKDPNYVINPFTIELRFADM